LKHGECLGGSNLRQPRVDDLAESGATVVKVLDILAFITRHRPRSARPRSRANARSCPLWSKKLGTVPPAVLIRDQRRRWASCDPMGKLRFNWRIIQAPMRLVEYVVAHELVHLTHRQHTAEFWAVLGKVIPDYEARREALRGIGASLQW
jgi:hypothetical protein